LVSPLWGRVVADEIRPSPFRGEAARAAFTDSTFRAFVDRPHASVISKNARSQSAYGSVSPSGAGRREPNTPFILSQRSGKPSSSLARRSARSAIDPMQA
jgi:hypothetical protein